MRIDPKTNGCEIMLKLPLPERQFSYVFMCFGTVKYMPSDQDVLVLLRVTVPRKWGLQRCQSCSFMASLHSQAATRTCFPDKIERQVSSSKPERDNRQQWTMDGNGI